MIDVSNLKDLLSRAEYTNRDKLLICLAVEPLRAHEVKGIRSTAIAHGLRKAKDWNVSGLLSASSELAVNTAKGWELTSEGLNRVAGLVGPLGMGKVPQVASSLRAHLPSLPSADVQAFVQEAIECFERGYYRAAIVLSWVGAVAVLQREVVASHLPAFNAEALRRNAKWKPAKTTDDLSTVKEKDFLEICQTISMLGKNVRQELDKTLQLRNGCGHPNSLKVGEHVAAAHIELLVLNVFQRAI